MKLLGLVEGDDDRLSAAMSMCHKARTLLADASIAVGDDVQKVPVPEQEVEWAIFQAGVWTNRAAELLKAKLKSLPGD